ncbi:TetR family transcriptional regulator [Spirillospora sp. CA-255316]
MARLTRAETQRRNRARVLAAARDEFAERGYREAKIDAIAERAELTRGAVYSNFPGKRALYFAVLADLADREPAPPPPGPAGTPGDALAAFARAWVARLPLATDQPYGAGRLGMDVIPEIIADERLRKPFAQLMKLDAVLLGLCLERLGPPVPQHLPGGRLVRPAEAALTTLQGAAQMAAAAPGFVEPFTIVGACRRLADLEPDDRWPGPPIVPRAHPAADPWSPPPATDAFRGGPVPFTGDGVVAVLGLHRLAAAEEIVRDAPPRAQVTAVLVTGAPDELAPLVRLVLADLRVCLRQAVPEAVWPRLRIVMDETGEAAAAAGVPAVSDATETAVRIESGRIVARAEGFGACHAAATWGRETGAPGRPAVGRESG